MEDDNHNFLNDLLILIITVCIISIACISCKSVEYIPVPSVKTDTVYSNTHRVDSVLHLDSIYIYEHADGDTVYRDKLVYRYRDRYRLVHDTVYRSRTDSVHVPYRVEVERELNLWEQAKVSIGGVAILICVLLGIIQFISKRRK